MDPDEPIESSAELQRLRRQTRSAVQLLTRTARRPRRGPQIDFGSTWTHPGRPEDVHRLSWDTVSKELTLTRRRDEAIELLGRYPSVEAVEDIFPGWGDRALAPGGIDWIHGRVAEHTVTGIGRSSQQRLAGMPSDRQVRFARLADRRDLDRHSHTIQPVQARER